MNNDMLPIGTTFHIKPDEISAGKCSIEAGGNCPLRPQGEWIIEYDHLKCPFCGMSINDEVHWLYSKEYNFIFCPNCGASMKGGVENE